MPSAAISSCSFLSNYSARCESAISSKKGPALFLINHTLEQRVYAVHSTQGIESLFLPVHFVVEPIVTIFVHRYVYNVLQNYIQVFVLIIIKW